MSEPRKTILLRIRLMYFLLAVFALVILARLLQIQFIEGEYWKERARQATLRYITIEAARGDICADDGRLLATSVPLYEIRMDLSRQVIADEVFQEGVDSLAWHLARLFGDRSAGAYRQALLQARRQQDRYYLVKRNVSYSQLQSLRRFPVFRLGRFRGGLIEVERTRREMPYRSLAARTIGYEREGYYVGLEGAYRTYLEGTSGKRLVQRTSGGGWMPINDENEIQPRNGMDVITTINVSMQDITENALRRQLQRFDADYGTAVIMEVATGKIKAISNLALNSRGEYEESFNFAVGESAEPGSTFKLATMIAILEEGLAQPEDLIATGNGVTQYADRQMRDAREGGFGTISLKQAFELSSNVALSRVIYEAWAEKPERFISRLRTMGLDQPLGLEIRGEGAARISDVNAPGWSGVSLPWMAIGYEVSLTPLQMLSLYNAVANQGRKMRPMFVEEIRQTGKTVKKFQPTVLQRSIASASTLAQVHDMLVGVVESGTARNIYNPVYSIAGKTGTAQVAQQGGGYRSESGITYQASFAGYFPADDPVYSGIIVINNPKGWNYSGSQVAAPVFREISDKIFALRLFHPDERENKNALAEYPSLRNLHTDDLKPIYAAFGARIRHIPDSQWSHTQAASDSIRLTGVRIAEGKMPDVRGMGLRDALYLLENKGLRVRYTGRGLVNRQSPSPGANIGKGHLVYIELN